MVGFLRGVATATITPFTENGVDFESFWKMIEAQIEGGTDALVVLGTTGEPATMTEAERDETIKFALSAAKGRIKIVVGTGSNSTAHAVALSRRAEELGADGVLAVTPYYNKCTQKGLVEYYKAISSAVRIPVIAYNVPSRTGVNILPATAEVLAEIPNLAGIKEASGDMTQVLDTARRIRGKCDLYSGEDALNLPILCAGGTAVISVLSNLAPRAVKTLIEAALSADLPRANALADALFPLAKACFIEVNPIPVKAGMEMLGFRAGAPRPPLTKIEPEHAEVLRAAMKAFGLEVVQ